MEIADWLPDREIDLRGRKKVLLAAGLSSRTGDADRQLGSLKRYLIERWGFRRGDFLEATYAGHEGPVGGNRSRTPPLTRSSRSRPALNR